MRLFAGKSSSLLGLDIGVAAVKLVELSAGEPHCRVEAFAVEPLPAHAIGTGNGGNISDADAVGEAVRRAVKRSGSKTRNAAVAVAGSAAITKTIALDASLTDADMEMEIALDADRHLPFPLDDVAMDFESMNLSVADPSQLDVLLVACRQEQVASLEATVALGGLKAVVVDVDTFCLHRVVDLLSNGPRGGATGLADVGAACVTLLVVDGDAVLFHREEAIERDEPMHGGAAVDGWHSPATAAPPAWADGSNDPRLHAISRLLRLYASAGRQGGGTSAGLHSFETGLGRLLLSGDGANAELASAATQSLGRQVELAAPFAELGVAQGIDAGLLDRQAPCLVKACGLALRISDQHETRRQRWCA